MCVCGGGEDNVITAIILFIRKPNVDSLQVKTIQEN